MRPVQYARAVLSNRLGKVSLPRFLTYIVTFTCNARCIMCDSWKKESPDDLTLEEIGRIFDQLPKLDSVRLTGGEPFVRKDLPDIAQLAVEKLQPLFLHITSNGFLTDRLVSFCETRDRSVPLQLLISVDGVGDKHNQVRGRETAWEGVTRTLQALAPRQKELRLRLSVNQTIVDPEGVEHYKRLRDFLRPLGVRNNVVMAYDASSTYSLDHQGQSAASQIGTFTTFGDFQKSHLEELIREIEKDLDGFPWVDRVAKQYYLRGMRNRLLEDVAQPNPGCVALNSHMRLYPNGDVPVCQFNARRVGNLRHQSFEEVWQGKDIEGQRRWVSKCPGCWAECEILPNAVYTGDLIRETLVPSQGASGSWVPQEA